MEQKLHSNQEYPQKSAAAELPIYTDIDKVPITLLEQMSTHWRVLYAQKRKLHDVSIRQIVWGQIFTIVVVASVSVLIEDNKTSLLLVGSTLILYPSLTDLLASNAAVLGASAHHDIDAIPRRKALAIAIATLRTVAVATLASSIVGFVAGLLGIWLFGTELLQTVQLATLAGLLAGSLGFPVLVFATFMARKLSANPDDVNPPLENTIFNVLVLLAIGVASRILA